MIHQSYLVQVRDHSPELEKFVLLQPLRQADVVEVVEAVDRVPQGLVILLFDEKVVVDIVHRLDVQLRRQR